MEYLTEKHFPYLTEKKEYEHYFDFYGNFLEYYHLTPYLLYVREIIKESLCIRRLTKKFF